MMNGKRVMFFVIFASIIAGCANKTYDEAMENGDKSLQDEEYEHAVGYFQEALEAKPKDEEATAHLQQTKNFMKGIEAFHTGNIDDAKEPLEDVLNYKDTSIFLQDEAKNQLIEIQQLQRLYSDVNKQYKQAKKLGEKQSFDEAFAILGEALDNDLDHPYTKPLQDDVTKYQTNLKKAKEKAVAKAKKQEEEKKQQEVETKQQAAEEKQFEKVLGYWLSLDETMACHITKTYMACAVAFSDVIFNEPITSMSTNIAEDAVTIHFEKDSEVTISTSKANQLEFDHDAYKRVSKKEANKIYDGYYELP